MFTFWFAIVTGDLVVLQYTQGGYLSRKLGGIREFDNSSPGAD